MAIGTTSRSDGYPSSSGAKPQAEGTSIGNAAATGPIGVNPIGTGPAKLLAGMSQQQVDALQKLKHDAYGVALADSALAALQGSEGSEADIKGAHAAASLARESYQQDLSEASGSQGLSAGRIGRYLLGGAHPVPDTALIPTEGDDLQDFIASLKDAQDGDGAAQTSRSAAQNPAQSAVVADAQKEAPGTQPGAKQQPAAQQPSPSQAAAPSSAVSGGAAPTATPRGTEAQNGSRLTAAQKAFLGNSSAVLSSSTTLETLPNGQRTPIKSGDLSRSFALYPFSNPVPNDINQNLSEDCYYLSALSSLTATPEGQAAIKKAITGPTASGDYTVSLFSPDGAPVAIVVNPNNLPVTSQGEPAFNHSARSDGQANWVNLMEAAYAKYNDIFETNGWSKGSGVKGYDGIMKNSITDTSFNQALTGKSSAALDLSEQQGAAVAAKMAQSLKAGKPVEAYNFDKADTTTSGGIALVPAHAYAVLNVSADGKTVTLRNPWGNNYPEQTRGQRADGQFTISMQDFMDSFEQVNL